MLELRWIGREKGEWSTLESGSSYTRTVAGRMAVRGASETKQEREYSSAHLISALPRAMLRQSEHNIRRPSHCCSVKRRPQLYCQVARLRAFGSFYGIQLSSPDLASIFDTRRYGLSVVSTNWHIRLFSAQTHSHCHETKPFFRTASLSSHSGTCHVETS